ncbi:MAG: hypothetical protein U0822_18675 [Anaerolineae bacterium]
MGNGRPMNATVKVTQVSPGRIRLHISNMAEQPEVYHRLVQYVLSLPEVTRVELEPSGEGLTIIHARTPQARDAILQTLRGTQAQKSAPAAAAPSSPPPPQPVRFPYADCTVAHAMRGRVRMRIPVLRANRTLAGVLDYHLRQQPGVKDVEVNRLSEGLTVIYDPAVTDAQALVATIAAYDPDAATIRAWQSARVSRRPRRRFEGIQYPAAIILAFAAAVLNYVGAPGILIFALLLGSSLSIYWRAVYTLVRRGRLSPALVAAIIITLLWATGRVWQAALVIVALTAVDWILSNPNRSVANAIADALDHVSQSSRASRNAKQIAAPAKAAQTTNPGKSLPLEAAADPGSFATPIPPTGTLTDAPPIQVSIKPEIDSPA